MGLEFTKTETAILFMGLVLCSPLLGVYWVHNKVRVRIAQRRAAYKSRKERQARRSFSSRRRAPTLPLAGEAVLVDRRTETQSQSRFFQLPLELREMVYLYILRFPGPIHIRRVNERLYGHECHLVRQGVLARDPGHDECFRRAVQGSKEILLRYPHRFLGLLSTCRRVYSEAIHMLYETNAFHLNNPRTLNILPQMIAPARLASIQVLGIHVCVISPHTYSISSGVLSAWRDASAVLEKMPGLQVLHVSFGAALRRGITLDGTRFVEPLMALRIPDFVVEIPDGVVLHGLEQQDGFSQYLPFRLVRREGR